MKKEKLTEIIVMTCVAMLTFSIFIWALVNQNTQSKSINFNRFKEELNKEVFDGLPKLRIRECSDMTVDFIGAYDFLGYIGLNVLYEYTGEESFASTLRDIENKTIAIYNSYDTCLVSVYNMGDIIYDCGKKYFPIYNEYDSPYGTKTTEILSDTVQYYVCNCKEGWYIKDDSLKNLVGNRTEYLRKKTYQHGFSNGAIVDRKKMKIVYWVFVW